MNNQKIVKPNSQIDQLKYQLAIKTTEALEWQKKYSDHVEEFSHVGIKIHNLKQKNIASEAEWRIFFNSFLGKLYSFCLMVFNQKEYNRIEGRLPAKGWFKETVRKFLTR